MNRSNTTPLSPEEYEKMLQVWSPLEEGDQALFLVRMPEGLQEMTQSNYEWLMSGRIQWMIQQWLKDTNQVQAHRMLKESLRKLLSYQEAPELYEDFQTKELQPLWWWMQEWAETFTTRNEALLAKFPLSFPSPVQPLVIETQQAWMEQHDTMTLENWLADLTYGME